MWALSFSWLAGSLQNPDSRNRNACWHLIEHSQVQSIARCSPVEIGFHLLRRICLLLCISRGFDFPILVFLWRWDLGFGISTPRWWRASSAADENQDREDGRKPQSHVLDASDWEGSCGFVHNVISVRLSLKDLQTKLPHRIADDQYFFGW
jgi:hypothetical protein